MKCHCCDFALFLTKNKHQNAVPATSCTTRIPWYDSSLAVSTLVNTQDWVRKNNIKTLEKFITGMSGSSEIAFFAFQQFLQLLFHSTVFKQKIDTNLY